MLLSKNKYNEYQSYSNNALIRLAQADDEVAKQVFVEKNQGLVYSCIKRFISVSICKDDLFQIGCVGLMKALNNFDLSLNLMFSTYAIPIILGEIKRFFRDDGNIRIARSIKENYIVMRKYAENFTQEYLREPTYEEIALGAGFEISEVMMAYEAHQQLINLDEPVDQSENMSLHQKIEAKQEDEILKIALQQEIQQLSEKEQLLLYFRFFLGYKQAEIATRLGVSQVQVSRLEKDILGKLKDKFRV